MLPIAELAREAALAVAVVVAGAYPAGAVDGATPDPAVPECAVASSSAERDRCPQGEDASVAASDDTPRASIVRRDPDSSEPASGSPGSIVSCAGRGRPGGNPGGGDQSSDDAAAGGQDRAGNDNADEVGPARSSMAGAERGSRDAQRTGPDGTGSESTGSNNEDSESEDSESEDSEKSGGEDSDSGDSKREDSKESGGSESEAEGSGDMDGDDEERKHGDRESADGEAAQTRNATGERTELVRQDDSAARYPADLINTDQWYLTLPTGEPGSPDTVEGDRLKTFSNDFFRLTPNRKGIVFAANAGGVTTENSEFPRSELREMNGAEKAAWSNTTGTHTLEVCEAVTKVPDGKPEVVAAQIHDGSDDVMQIRLEDRTLMVQYDDGAKSVVLDKAYQLGTPYQLRIVAADRKVTVTYNGEQKAELPLSGSRWYWKVGAYVQANQERSDPQDLGEVIVYSSQITHDDEDGDGAGPAGGGSGAVADEQKDSDGRAASDDNGPGDSSTR
jgi:hypothetical protein